MSADEDAWLAKQGTRMEIEQINPGGISAGKRLRALDHATIGALKTDIEIRGLLHPLIVRRLESGQPELISGYHRLLAVKALEWEGVPCRVVAVDDQEKEAMEIVENLKRKELTQEERDAHRLRLGALLKEKPSTGLTVSGKGGRGKRGVKSRIAEAEGVTKAAIAKAEQRVAEAIGEPVDLDRDSPAELERKADKVRSAPKPPKAPRAAKPKAAPRPKRPGDLRVRRWELVAAWPKQVDEGALSSVERKGLCDAARELRQRLDQIEAAPGAAQRSAPAQPAVDGLVAARKMVEEVLTRPDLRTEGRKLAKAVLAEMIKVQASFYAGLSRSDGRLAQLAERAPDVKAEAIRRKVQALAERGATDGERAAAAAALERLPKPEPARLAPEPEPLPKTREEMLARKGDAAWTRTSGPGCCSAPRPASAA